MEEMLKNVEVGDLIRFQFVMNSRNQYATVKKITNKYIELYNSMIEKNIKFRKKDGWGIGTYNRYHVCGINDKEKYSQEDLNDLYYY